MSGTPRFDLRSRLLFCLVLTALAVLSGVTTRKHRLCSGRS